MVYGFWKGGCTTPPGDEGRVTLTPHTHFLVRQGICTALQLSATRKYGTLMHLIKFI